MALLRARRGELVQNLCFLHQTYNQNQDGYASQHRVTSRHPQFSKASFNIYLLLS